MFSFVPGMGVPILWFSPRSISFSRYGISSWMCRLYLPARLPVEAFFFHPTRWLALFFTVITFWCWFLAFEVPPHQQGTLNKQTEEFSMSLDQTSVRFGQFRWWFVSSWLCVRLTHPCPWWWTKPRVTSSPQYVEGIMTWVCPRTSCSGCGGKTAAVCYGLHTFPKIYFVVLRHLPRVSLLLIAAVLCVLPAVCQYYSQTFTSTSWL